MKGKRYRRPMVLLRREGINHCHNAIYRIYREENLGVKKRKRVLTRWFSGRYAEAGDFGAKLLGEGREVAETRKKIEQERAGLQAQVSMREVGLIDAESVAQQLLTFHAVMGELSAEEQKDLVRFLLKEIRVNRFDPNKDKGELGEGEIPVKIRTQWFVLNITFFSNDLFTRALRDGVKGVRNLDKMAARAGIEPATK